MLTEVEHTLLSQVNSILSKLSVFLKHRIDPVGRNFRPARKQGSWVVGSYLGASEDLSGGLRSCQEALPSQPVSREGLDFRVRSNTCFCR